MKRSIGNYVVALGVILWACCVGAHAAQYTDNQVAAELAKDANQQIINEFLRYELREVNDNVTKAMLPKHPSLIFFINQADRGPMKNLSFLEKWVHKLQDAQRNINSLPYSITFFGEEKKKILELKPVADRIVSYGIPLMKRDFFKVVQAARYLADKKHKHPMALVPDASFRDDIYRHVEPTAAGLDTEMGKLSEGEEICIKLGWVLEQVTVTNVWMAISDNKLPDPNDYSVFRKKRSEYFQKKLNRIYGNSGGEARPR
jgi:hypothetical protein